jgi:hypothetical protein
LRSNSNIEDELTEYFYAKRDIRWLEADLERAIKHYDECVNYLPGHDYRVLRDRNHISKPVEAAMILLDERGEDLKEIKRKLAGARRTVRRIDGLIERAGLTGRERAYVRIRYCERGNLPGCVEYTQRAMSYEESQALRIKASALRKLEKARECEAGIENAQ